jgi:hypothetical protein
LGIAIAFSSCTKKKRQPATPPLMDRDSLSFIRKEAKARLSFHALNASECKVRYGIEGSASLDSSAECVSNDKKRFFVLFKDLVLSQMHSFSIELKGQDRNEAVILNEKDLSPYGNHVFESLFYSNTQSFHLAHFRVDESYQKTLLGCEASPKKEIKIYEPTFSLSGFSFAQKEGAGWLRLYGFHHNKDWTAKLGDGFQTITATLNKPTHPEKLVLNGTDLLANHTSPPVIESNKTLTVDWLGAANAKTTVLQIAVRQGDKHRQCTHDEKNVTFDTSDLDPGPFHLQVAYIDRVEKLFFEDNFEPWIHSNIQTFDLIAVKKPLSSLGD